MVRRVTGTTLFRTISDLQRNLDTLDIEGLSKLWSQVHPTDTIGSGITNPPLFPDWTDFADDYLKTHKDQNHESPEPTETQLMYYLQAYLLSATFKDCSIMFRIGGEEFIKVIDLDIKGVEKLPKWLALDREIVAAYTGEKVCVDANYPGS